MNNKSYCVYRPELDKLPSVNLPVFPRSMGYVIRYGDYHEYVPKGEKNFVQLFWGAEGEAEFEIGGKIHTLKIG